jgi:hypothetical protein
VVVGALSTGSVTSCHCQSADSDVVHDHIRLGQHQGVGVACIVVGIGARHAVHVGTTEGDETVGGSSSSIELSPSGGSTKMISDGRTDATARFLSSPIGENLLPSAQSGRPLAAWPVGSGDRKCHIDLIGHLIPGEASVTQLQESWVGRDEYARRSAARACANHLYLGVAMEVSVKMPIMRGIRGVRVALEAVLSGVVIAFVVSVAANSVPVAEHPEWRPWLWAAVSVCAAALLAIGTDHARQKVRARAGPTTLDEAAKRWVDAVEAWAFPEARIRGLDSTHPLTVTWASTRRPISASRSEVLRDSPTKTWDDHPLTGSTRTIKQALTELPFHQMVILGPAGSGKSTLSLLLVRDLMEATREGKGPNDPIPVLLNAAEWNPALTLEDSLASTMEKEAQYLAQPAIGSGHDESWAKLLLRRRRVFPVLDGLDELPVSARAGALRAWSGYCATPGPAVLTSRIDEYAAAIGDLGHVLPRTAVIEVDPITVDATINYLTQQEHRRLAWEPVVRAFKADNQAAVAKALRTPLYVFLARSVYAMDDPAELCAYTTPVEIRRHLLRRFIPATYEDETSPHPPPGLKLHAYRPDKATCWLTYLAYLSRVIGSRNIQPKRALPEMLSRIPP